MTLRTTTAVVTKGTQTATVSIDGTLSPQKQASLNFSVSGQVTKVYVKAGQKVIKGQKLATIDSSSLSDAVDLAAANLTSAQANYSDVSASGTSAAKKSARAQVSSAAASLASAKEDLKAATIRSSMNGTIASVGISVGDQVAGTGSSSSSANSTRVGASTSATSSSAEIVVIATSTWKLAGTVGATDLSSIKAGQSAVVTVESVELAGKVSSVGIVSTTTNSNGAAAFPVVINISGTHKNLYSGTTATALVTTGTYSDVLTVATNAITGQGGKTMVTKIAGDGTTSRVEVTVGRTFGDVTEITKGLSEGDKVQITFRPLPAATNRAGGGGLFGGGGGGAPGGGGPNQ
jgi:macrolide-specific efflux system membrane fusion protein